MKKICLILLAVVLLICGIFLLVKIIPEKKPESTAAYSLYTEAKQLYVGGYAAKVTVRMQEEGEELVSGTLHIKVQGDNVAITRSNSEAARYLIGEVAYRSGYFYVDEYDETAYAEDKIKERMTKEAFQKDVMGFFGIGVYASDFPTFSEEVLQNAVLVESGDYRSFTSDISLESIRSYLGDSTIPTAVGSMAASFNKAGAMMRMALIMHVTYADGAQRAFEIVYDFSNPEYMPAVLPPTDANSYLDMT